MVTSANVNSGSDRAKSDLPPDQEQIAKTLTDMDGELAALRAAFDQYFIGVDKHNPAKDCEDFKKRLLKVKGQFIRNTALKFRVQSLYQKFQSYERLWLKTLKEMEEGTYRRDIMRLRRKNDRRKVEKKPVADDAARAADMAAPDADEPPARKNVFTLDDLEADLPSELFDDQPSIPAAPPARPATPPALAEPVAARASTGTPPTAHRPPPPPAAVAPRSSTGSLPAVAAPASAPRAPASGPPPPPPVARTAPGSVPAAGGPPPPPVAARVPTAPPAGGPPPPPPAARTMSGSMPAVGAPPAVGRPAPGAGAAGGPPPAPVDSAARRPSQVPTVGARPPVAPRTSTGSLPIAVASGPASQPARSDLPLSQDKLQQIYTAYVTAKKRCKESTDGITLDAVKQSLSRQVPQLMKDTGAKSVDFKVVIKDGKAVLKAVPK